MAENRHDYAKKVIMDCGVNKGTAELILDRLREEGMFHAGYGDADVDAVVEKFTTTFGTTKTSKYDRFAANRLIQKYGTNSVVGIIGLLAEKSHEQYAPVVNNISELEKKFVSVMHFLRSADGEETIQV